MSIFKQPSALVPKYALSALIYAQPGTGKTTLACSSPGCVLLDYDGGVTRINGAHRVPTLQVQTWEDTRAALDELRDAPAVESVIIDTVGKMLDYMTAYIVRTNPKMRAAGGGLSLKGYGVRKQMFIDLIRELTLMGKNVIFVAHDKEERRGDDTVIRPEIGGSSAADLMKELDLVGYMEMDGGQRVISFDPCGRFYAKNTCGLGGRIAVPELAPGQANDFLRGVIDAYRARQRQSIQETADYEELMAMISDNVAEIGNAADANNFLEWAKGVKHIYDSRARMGALLTARATALGLTYDKTSRTYGNE